VLSDDAGGRNEAFDIALAEVESVVPELLARHDVPGLAVGVFAAGQVAARCFGSLGRTDPRPVEPGTIFSVQSVSKLFTATAVMVLVDAGIVDLDAPITEYLQEFSVRSAFETGPEGLMTIRHLLSHTAGFTHEAPIGSNYGLEDASFDEHLESISQTWLRFPVGHHCEYSNLGVDLAGAILERRTGASFSDAVRELLFEPLGLEASSYDLGAIAAAPSRAIGHEPGFASVPLKVPMVTSGGLYTSLDDAMRFAAFHQRQCVGLLSESTHHEMRHIPFAAQGQEFGYALGIHHQSRGGGVPISGHAGNGFGFHADLAWSEAEDFGVVVLVNSGHPGVKWRVADDVIGKLGTPVTPQRLDRVSIQHEPRKASDGEFTGSYLGRQGSAQVTGLSGSSHLNLQLGASAEDLTRIEDDLFAGDSQDVEFLRDGSHVVRHMRRLGDGATFYRNIATPGTAAGLLEGNFEVHQWGQRVALVTVLRVYGHGVLRLQWDGEPTQDLWLTPVADGVFLTTTGETLDLVQTPASYASLTLRATQP